MFLEGSILLVGGLFVLHVCACESRFCKAMIFYHPNMVETVHV